MEQEVNERIRKYEQAENDQLRGLIALCGSLAYGEADSPRQEQMERGVAYFKQLREHQQQIKQAIEELNKTNTHANNYESKVSY